MTKEKLVTMVTKILIVSIPDHTSGVVKAGHASASR